MENGPDRQLVAAHLLAFSAGGALLWVPGVELRFIVWAFVITYNAALPLYFRALGEERVVSIWSFALPLSLFQVLPDWFLSEELGTLVFPSAPDSLAVPLFMAGLWVPPLVLTTYLGERVRGQASGGLGLLSAALGGLAIFATSELVLTSVRIWEPVDVYTVGGMALYILGPEALLCASTLYAYRETRRSPAIRRVAAAGLVSCLYLGAAGASYLVVERWVPALLG